MMTDNNSNVFVALILKAQNGSLTPGERRQFNDMMSDSANQQIYFEAVKLHCALQQISASAVSGGSGQAHNSAGKSLGRIENTEPSVYDFNQRRIRFVTTHTYKEKRSFSGFRKFVASACAAVILLLVFADRLIPVHDELEVAAVTSQENVEWADSKIHFSDEQPLSAESKHLAMKRGIFNFHFNDGADVSVEGPAMFSVERGGVYLEYGRLHCRIEKSAAGFRIRTPKVDFVDLGTEFGVQADIDGSAQLNVTEGKVLVRLCEGGVDDISLIVAQNNAVRYDAGSGRLTEVPVSNAPYAQQTNPRAEPEAEDVDTHIPEEPSPAAAEPVGLKADLIDILCGGDGFGTGDINSTILTDAGTMGEGGVFYSISGFDVVDSAFLLNGKNVPTQIASNGMMYPGFAGSSDALISLHLRATRYSEKYRLYLDEHVIKGIAGRAYMIRSNQGITFDLKAIADKLRKGVPAEFSTRFGISGNLPLTGAGGRPREVNCWVLVDGEARFERAGITSWQEDVDIAFELHATDRYLTLVVTEDNQVPGLDSSFFTHPALIFREGQ